MKSVPENFLLKLWKKTRLRSIFLVFGAVQTVVLCLILSYFLFGKVVPQLDNFKKYSDGILNNANFSFVDFKNSQLDTDVMPEIYTFVMEDNAKDFAILVVDKKNQLNPFFWEHRDKFGDYTRRVNGIILDKERITLKADEKEYTMSYKSLGLSGDRFSKEDLKEASNVFNWVKDNQFLILGVAFVSFFVIGLVAHILFTYVATFFAKLLTKAFNLKRRSDIDYPYLKFFALCYIPWFAFMLWLAFIFCMMGSVLFSVILLLFFHLVFFVYLVNKARGV